jgi:dimethylargininase
MLIAITRQVSPAIQKCELTHLKRVPIDVGLARAQHQNYEETLRSLGVEVHSLSEEQDLPDSVFVEDTAVVLDECALITRPGASSRQPETEAIERTLAPYRTRFTIQAPGTLDGGDVLTVGKTIFVGLSGRSNKTAITQLEAFLAPFGYAVKGVAFENCLHLKSAVTLVRADTLLINPCWVDRKNFPGMKFIAIDPSEPYAANALMVGERVLSQPAFQKTLALLEAGDIHPIQVDQSELGKAEGALTCCSLIFRS